MQIPSSAPSHRPDGPSAPATLAEIVIARAGDRATGLRFEDQSWTWAQVVQAGADRAALLAAVPRPSGRQVHVGILAENVPEYVFWTAGCALAGAVLVGLNTSRSAREISADAAHADLDLVLVEPALMHLAAELSDSLECLELDSDRYRALLAPHRGAALPTSRPRPEDLAFLLFSSGSTGTPKAVIVGQGRMARLAPALVERVEASRTSVAYLSMPLFHGNSLMMNLVASMLAGGQVALTRRFSASRFSADIHRFGATYTNYVGRALSYVLSSPTDPRDATSSLRLAFGTEASEADAARFAARFGAEVREGYGMSEGVLRINRTPETPPGALGLPTGALDVRILDEDSGAECPRGMLDAAGRLSNPEAIGQFVAIGGAAGFEGYWKNPAATADRVRPSLLAGQLPEAPDDFWSGDLGFRDTDGWFWFAGRSSDWLRVDSENFAAAQVERILQRHPDVSAAPVVAVPDPVTGDAVLAVLELLPGVRFDAEEFGAFLSAQADLGAKWWPAFVRVTGQVPLTGSNKVDKTPLRRTGFLTEDPIWVRSGRSASYLPLDAAGREDLVAQYAEHGRAALLPVPR